MAERGMGAALAFFNSRRGDTFTIIHISDLTKSYLSKHLHPSHLKNYYIDLAYGARVKADWLCREKEEGRTTCESLTRLAERSGTDLLVLGSWGRKGEKLDALGTVSEFTLRQSRCSLCIVRSTGATGFGGGGTGGARYLFATDGSHAAHLAFSFLLAYVLRPADFVVVVTVTAEDGTAESRVIQQYSEYMRKRKVNGECHVRCVDRLSTTVPEGIVDAVAAYSCDVLVMGISGYGRKKLGSVSEDISTRASCTTLLIKDPA
ncbi:hypothetical protein TSOC_008646 [Tetrabaena socialis]|uniref:UspA domain-containing protein n=1 Tax=Tetrabaena socialis TaxID=47790 RepID=A0A2J7ZXX5_9CHLO|nr:hypothetical protein TSOC_008646 [Tetrabaena socialis]|eukprot:PNH05119.1 hypothetical protein TSOC_008646 [Tetrabaena socialis]